MNLSPATVSWLYRYSPLVAGELAAVGHAPLAAVSAVSESSTITSFRPSVPTLLLALDHVAVDASQDAVAWCASIV